MIAVGVTSCSTLVLTSCGNSTPSATGRGRRPPPGVPSLHLGTGASTGGTGAATVGMAAPAGYTQQQLIFDDVFAGTSLDSSKWSTFGRPRDQVGQPRLPACPYSGPNTPLVNNEAMFGPSEVSVDNGLTLTTTPNTNQYSTSTRGSAVSSPPMGSSACRRLAGTSR